MMLRGTHVQYGQLNAQLLLSLLDAYKATFGLTLHWPWKPSPVLVNLARLALALCPLLRG